MTDERKMKHTVIMQERENIKMTGVLDVISFDELTIVAETTKGILVLKGNQLHVNQLNLENGELGIDGEIINLSYEEKEHYGKSGGAFFSKIFK